MGKIEKSKQKSKQKLTGNDSQGSRLRWERQRYNLSVKDLADKIGCSKQYISNIENGSAPIGEKTAHKIAAVIPVNPDYLTGKSENPAKLPDFTFFTGSEYFKGKRAADLIRFISGSSDKFLIRPALKAAQDPINSAGKEPADPESAPWSIEDMRTGLSSQISQEDMAVLFNAVLEYAEMFIENHLVTTKAEARIRSYQDNDSQQGYLDLFPEE